MATRSKAKSARGVRSGSPKGTMRSAAKKSVRARPSAKKIGTGTGRTTLRLHLVTHREDDGRWFGEVASLPGVMAYGETRDEAVRNTQSLALHVIADRLAHGEAVPLHGFTFTVPR